LSKKNNKIPINSFSDELNIGISIDCLSSEGLPIFEGLGQAERHNWHSFHFLEKGNIDIEIDFEKYKIIAPAIVYLHPNQVHRITAFEGFTVVTWAASNENINTEYLRILEKITPVKPIDLDDESYTLISDATSLGLKYEKRKSDKLYHSLLKDNINSLIALVVSQFLVQSQTPANPSRYFSINQTFHQLLNQNYTTLKRPADYAQLLNISVPYLNECVKNTTGQSVTYHIHQRIILEAKRLLVHTAKSVKEIAAILGYDDYPYFSKLFTKVVGRPALALRSRNHD
jgi:AraC family transcriptional regulator, transcriptional activator of pobA